MTNRTDPGVFISGLRSRLLKLRFRLYLLKIVLREYPNPVVAGQVLRKMISFKRNLRGTLANPRWLKVRGRYFWNINTPGWPSAAFESFVKHEMHRIRPLPEKQNRLQTLVYSITSHCPLHCEHCYEWNNLSSEELLSLEQLKQILRRFQEQGVSNVQLSGGEPLCRFQDLLELLASARDGTDFWLLSSGWGLDEAKARALKLAGLTGIALSLDHWQADIHDRFRGRPGAFDQVWKAAEYADKAGLAVALSLCATWEFVSEENLNKYLTLAQSKGVWIVRILEPRAVGHYTGQDIELEEEQLKLLDDWFLKVNRDPAGRNLPLLDYTVYYQRRSGCFGGDRYLYVDSRGDMHACPFCQHPAGNALEASWEKALASLQQQGCLKYPKAGANLQALSPAKSSQAQNYIMSKEQR